MYTFSYKNKICKHDNNCLQFYYNIHISKLLNIRFKKNYFFYYFYYVGLITYYLLIFGFLIYEGNKNQIAKMFKKTTFE